MVSLGYDFAARFQDLEYLTFGQLLKDGPDLKYGAREVKLPPLKTSARCVVITEDTK